MQAFFVVFLYTTPHKKGNQAAGQNLRRANLYLQKSRLLRFVSYYLVARRFAALTVIFLHRVVCKNITIRERQSGERQASLKPALVTYNLKSLLLSAWAHVQATFCIRRVYLSGVCNLPRNVV